MLTNLDRCNPLCFLWNSAEACNKVATAKYCDQSTYESLE